MDNSTMKEGEKMQIWSNHKGSPHDLNIYHDDSGWTLATVLTVKRFPDLPSLLSAMVRDGITTTADAENIKKKIIKKHLRKDG